MDAIGPAARAATALPAHRIDAAGQSRIDWRAVLRLTLPLMANSSLQAIISLTDTWFVGQISTGAVAGMGSIYWFAFFFILLAGGVGLAVQTLVAQAEGVAVGHAHRARYGSRCGARSPRCRPSSASPFSDAGS